MTTDTESRELDELVERASIADVFASAYEQRSTNGATAELQQHYGINSNQVPLALLETRAVTPAPSNVGRNQSTIVPYVFNRGAAAFLGVGQPVVPVGQHTFPVLTTPPTVRTPAENASAAETTGSFSANNVSPARLQASFFWSREDAASFAGMGDALAQALAEGLSDGLDNQVLNNSSGLMGSSGITAPTKDTGASATSFANIRSRVHAAVDGRYAGSASDLRLVCNAATYGVLAQQYNSDGVNAMASLMAETGGLRVSGNMPGNSDSGRNGEILIARGMATNMVAPIWEGITLIPDEITRAANGQVQLTAIMLYAVSILRSDGFTRIAVRTGT